MYDYDTCKSCGAILAAETPCPECDHCEECGQLKEECRDR